MSVAGRWRIMETELWDREALDLVGPAFIEFGEDGSGSFGFIAVQGWMDCREAPRDGRPGVEFPGRAAMTAIRPPAAAGRCWRTTARCAGASSSTSATTQALRRCETTSRSPGRACPPVPNGRGRDRDRSQAGRRA